MLLCSWAHTRISLEVIQKLWQMKIKIKDAALQNNLRDVMKTNFLNSENLHYASDQQLMFAVDNMRGDEKELIKVRERLDDVIKQEFDDFSIPASWLMFSIFLRKMSMMGNHTLTLLQCHKIGERLKSERHR